MANGSNLPGGAITGAQVAAGDLFYIWDISATGIARTKSITVAELRRALGEGYNAQTWASGALTITPGDYVQRHLEILTVTLSAGTYTLTVADGTASTRFGGNRLQILLKLPGTDGIVVNVTNGAGSVEKVVRDDGTGDDHLVELYHNGTSWKLLTSQYPAN